MSSIEKKENRFVGYEYKTVKVRKEREGLWSDSMESFGWNVEKSEPATIKRVWGPLRLLLAPLALIPGSVIKDAVSDHKSESHVELTFKRNKHIANKPELNRLQAQFEAEAQGIDDLEDSKTIRASIAAYVVGLIGTVFMGLSVFAFLAAMTPHFIFLAVPGFLGWVAAHFVYRRVKANRTKHVQPMLDERFDSIYDVCKKGSDSLITAQ